MMRRSTGRPRRSLDKGGLGRQEPQSTRQQLRMRVSPDGVRYAAAAFFIAARTSSGFQSLVGYQAATLPSLPMRMVEREWVMVLGSVPVTPTLKNWVTAGRSFSE